MADFPNQDSSQDPELAAVAAIIRGMDPQGSRIGQVLRDTLDQLYDGQRTGRYRWDQLFKTEKTHCGTLVEINIQREFKFADGLTLDFQIGNAQVDCKYSQTLGGWMIPPEALGHLCLLVWADDSISSWSLGIVRITADRLNAGGNRDRKATLNQEGRNAIIWLFDRARLPENVLLQLELDTIKRIESKTSGQRRVCELFRLATGRVIGRVAVATIAKQQDYMKRVRDNGGARAKLKKEGIVILGHYSSHLAIARILGIATPRPGSGDFVSVRLARAVAPGPGVAEIDGGFWRVASPADPPAPAPKLPKI